MSADVATWLSWHEAGAGEPPVVLEQELQNGIAELQQLHSCWWVHPPTSRIVTGAIFDADHVGSTGLSGPRVEAPKPPPLPPEELNYKFKYVTHQTAKDVIGVLLAPAHASGTGISFAQEFGKALENFAQQVYDVLITPKLLPEVDRNNLVREAEEAMKALVDTRQLNVASDLVFCLEAFRVTRGASKAKQEWLCQFLCISIKAALSVATDEDAERWKESIRSRLHPENDERDIYVSVDVRSWPAILELVGLEARHLNHTELLHRIQLQLCASRREEVRGPLFEAAHLISELGQTACFGADEILKTFNDKTFDRKSRKDLLVAVLQGSPRAVKMEVLRKIDGDDVELEEFDNEEILLVRQLLCELKEDVRCCKHTFFKMKSDWLVARWTGVVKNEELSPEQVCDHIEGDDNHQELLKVAVNRCLKESRKFEAARFLARPQSAGTRVFESNRNDKQLEYLVSLYRDLSPPRDQFGPVEESCLVIPCSQDQIIHVKTAGKELKKLEQETLGHKQPLVMGIWWLWRCFDPNLDTWSRASIVAMVYEHTFAIVDLENLEKLGESVEARSKDVLRRILEADHLLKVVHGMDANSLKVLQRALVPHQTLVDDEAPVYPGISPMIDLGLVAAYVCRLPNRDTSWSSKLTALSFVFLRLELCIAEALSNYERRPLRLTQLHYALVLAWCPLMILRVFCAYKLVTRQDLQLMLLQLAFDRSPDNWDHQLRCAQPFNDGAAGDEGIPGDVEGGYGENPATNEDWHNKLPRPDTSFNLKEALHKQIGPLLLPSCPQAESALEQLFDKDRVIADFESLYEAYHSHQRMQQEGDAEDIS